MHLLASFQRILYEGRKENKSTTQSKYLPQRRKGLVLSR